MSVTQAVPPGAPAAPPPDAPRRVRIGLGYIRGVRRQEMEALVAAREAAGRFRSLADLASRVGAGAPALELLAWSGACDSLACAPAPGSPLVTGSTAAIPSSMRSPRRRVLWQLGVATPGRGVPGGVQLALPLDLPTAPRLRELSDWDAMLADYGTTGLTVAAHPIQLLRARLPDGCVDSRDLERLPHGSRVRAGGLVVARQRPGTAGGVVFVLLEDEFGVINLIVPPKVYERHRLIVRTEPLLLVAGKLERFAAAGGGINVLVDQVGSIAAPDRLVAQVKDFSLLDEQVRIGRAEQEKQAADGDDQAHGDDFRAVAPAVMSFGAGRRR